MQSCKHYDLCTTYAAGAWHLNLLATGCACMLLSLLSCSCNMVQLSVTCQSLLASGGFPNLQIINQVNSLSLPTYIAVRILHSRSRAVVIIRHSEPLKEEPEPSSILREVVLHQISLASGTMASTVTQWDHTSASELSALECMQFACMPCGHVLGKSMGK